MTDGTPSRLQFQLTHLGGGEQFPVQQNEAFRVLLDHAVSGGGGTAEYLQRMRGFAALAAHLGAAGTAAYRVAQGPANTLQATAGDGAATLAVNLQLQPPPAAGSAPGAAPGPPVVGTATVRMALSPPDNITRIAQFGVSLAELPAGVAVTQSLWEALFQPLLGQLSRFVQGAIERWLSTAVGDAAELGEALQGATGAAAVDVGEEAAEVVVEEAVVAEVAVDLSAAVPPLGALALLMAVPILLDAAAQPLALHLEVENLTGTGFNWSLPHLDEGSVVVQPASALVAAMGTLTDPWGDQSSVPVVYTADFTAVNPDGCPGIGFVLGLSPQGYTGEDIAAVVSIPCGSDNGVWLGDPGSATGPAELYAANRGGTGGVTASYGNRVFHASLAIDALSGDAGEYHCILRLERL